MSGLKMLDDNVLIQPEEAVKTTPGGLHIPDNASEGSRIGRGTVIHAGLKANIQNGVRVLHDKIDAIEVMLEGSKHYIVKMKNVLAVIK